jgi:hypothetical protein
MPLPENVPALRTAFEFRDNSHMRLPPLSRTVHIALLFVSHFILGIFVAAWGTYQFEQSRWLASLSREQGKQVLSLRQTLFAAQPTAGSTPDAFANDLSRLQTIRRRAPQEAQPILDLRIAADHAVLARLDQDANDPAGAAAQAGAAQALLRGLGWKSTSEAILSELADRRLHGAVMKEVR